MIVTLLEIAQKVNKILGYICETICCQELVKLAQLGHTDHCLPTNLRTQENRTLSKVIWTRPQQTTSLSPTTYSYLFFFVRFFLHLFSATKLPFRRILFVDRLASRLLPLCLSFFLCSYVSIFFSWVLQLAFSHLAKHLLWSSSLLILLLQVGGGLLEQNQQKKNGKIHFIFSAGK